MIRQTATACWQKRSFLAVQVHFHFRPFGVEDRVTVRVWWFLYFTSAMMLKALVLVVVVVPSFAISLPYLKLDLDAILSICSMVMREVIGFMVLV